MRPVFETVRSRAQVRFVLPATRVGSRRSRANPHTKIRRANKLPPNVTVDYELLAEDIGKLLAEQPKHDQAKQLRKLKNNLEKFEERGGFPANFVGDATVTYEAPNGKLAEHAEFVHQLVRDEYAKQWLQMRKERPAGPYRTSPIFVTPKKTGGRPNGKWRFIHHLSWAPPGMTSVNEDCPITDIEIRYEDVPDYTNKIMQLKRQGPVLLWKTDLDGAYKQWPFEESHRRRMGFRWLPIDQPVPEEILRGEREPREDELVYYFINRLPFGWTQSVVHFTRVSLALKALHLWENTPGVEPRVPRAVHDTSTYVDDTGGVGLAIDAGTGVEVSPSASKAELLRTWAGQSKLRFHAVCERYRVPISQKKELLEGAIEATKEFLGICIDTIKDEKRLSEERVAEGLRRLKELDGKAYVSTKELRSLVGVLSFAAQACGPHARTFLRRCWDLLARSKGRWTRLGRGVQADLQFWKRFWSSYNGTSMTAQLGWDLSDDLGIFTDASLSGWGAVYDGEWMGGEWPESARGLAINELELLAIALAASRWGPKWARRRIITTCDNQAAMWCVNTGAARSGPMMVAMRELFLAASANSFEMKCQWIETKLNIMADAISRGDYARFYEHATNVLNIEQLTQVKPTLDVERVVARMQKARRAEARRRRA